MSFLLSVAFVAILLLAAMALLYDMLALAIGAILTAFLFPALVTLVGSTIGRQVRSKTQQRRTLLQAGADVEESEQAGANVEESEQAGASVDESEWEKIDSGAKTPAAQNGQAARNDADFDGVIGFFHPFCNAGGGGERVLFAALLATQQRYPHALCVVYTGDHDASKASILNNAKNRFNIHLSPARVTFLYLSTREWVLASKWPHFTLLGQSLGSLVLGWDAFNLLTPDIFIDTMGYAFTLALSKWLFPSMPTGAYVHYPTISTDMLSSLADTHAGRGVNAGLGIGLRGKAKQYYWHLFAALYSWVGGNIDVVMANSSWTSQHIRSLWAPSRTARRKQHPITVLFPPVAVHELAAKIPLNSQSEQTRTRNILYIAQFRPEKAHGLILDAFSALLKSRPDLTTAHALPPRLILAGSVRDAHDEKRVYALRLQAQAVKQHVDFVVNAPWARLTELLASASVGVNAMWNEHFGIGVVEYQAAGLVCVVHDSGGPKADIVVDFDGGPTGFLARTPEQFRDGFVRALELAPDQALAMRRRARASAARFGEEVFARAWAGEVGKLVEMCGQGR